LDYVKVALMENGKDELLVGVKVSLLVETLVLLTAEKMAEKMVGV
jgi:hypothetical protein